MNRKERVFVAAAGAVLFGVLLAGVAGSMGAGRGEVDRLLSRTRGERVGQPVGAAQASYTLEVRRGGAVVPVRLADLQPRVVFVNFWGTFCPPCIEELPSLLAMAKARAADDFLVLAVSYDESWEAIDTFFRRAGALSIPPNFVIARDPERQPGRDLKTAFGTEKLPESYVLRDGLIEAKYVSARDWTDPDVLALMERLAER